MKNKTVGSNIKLYRETAKLTQKQLASVVGKSKQTVSLYECETLYGGRQTYGSAYYELHFMTYEEILKTISDRFRKTNHFEEQLQLCLF